MLQQQGATGAALPTAALTTAQPVTAAATGPVSYVAQQPVAAAGARVLPTSTAAAVVPYQPAAAQAGGVMLL